MKVTPGSERVTRVWDVRKGQWDLLFCDLWTKVGIHTSVPVPVRETAGKGSTLFFIKAVFALIK